MRSQRESRWLKGRSGSLTPHSTRLGVLTTWYSSGEELRSDPRIDSLCRLRHLSQTLSEDLYFDGLQRLLGRLFAWRPRSRTGGWRAIAGPLPPPIAGGVPLEVERARSRRLSGWNGSSPVWARLVEGRRGSLSMPDGIDPGFDSAMVGSADWPGVIVNLANQGSTDHAASGRADAGPAGRDGAPAHASARFRGACADDRAPREGLSVAWLAAAG